MYSYERLGVRVGGKKLCASAFIVTGFLIAPVEFAQAVVDNFFLIAGIVAALLVGKGVAAFLAGRAFGYPRQARLEMWAR